MHSLVPVRWPKADCYYLFVPFIRSSILFCFKWFTNWLDWYFAYPCPIAVVVRYCCIVLCKQIGPIMHILVNITVFIRSRSVVWGRIHMFIPNLHTTANKNMLVFNLWPPIYWSSLDQGNCKECSVNSWKNIQQICHKQSRFFLVHVEYFLVYAWTMNCLRLPVS